MQNDSAKVGFLRNERMQWYRFLFYFADSFGFVELKNAMNTCSPFGWVELNTAN